MKKLLFVLLALTVIGSLASAQVTMGTWNRIGMNLYKSSTATGAVAQTQDQPSWGRDCIQFAAKADFFGINCDAEFHPESGQVAIGDNAKIYAKLFDKKVTISFGKGYFDNLRGKMGGAQSVGTMWGGDEDAIFQRFTLRAGGVMLELAPVDGLYIGVDVVGPNSSSAQAASITYRDINVGAGYTIPDVGLVRAQFISSGYANQAIQAAFAFTGVAGLTVDAGAKFFITKTTAQNFASVAVKYSKDALGAMARTKVLLPNDPAKLDVSLGANVNYKVADTIVLGADLGLNSILATGKLVAATPYLQYNAPGGGTIQAGVLIQATLDGTSVITYGIPVVFTF